MNRIRGVVHRDERAQNHEVLYALRACVVNLVLMHGKCEDCPPGTCLLSRGPE
jgi:hypothetical protein